MKIKQTNCSGLLIIHFFLRIMHFNSNIIVCDSFQSRLYGAGFSDEFSGVMEMGMGYQLQQSCL